ncbi:unnamed protein product [Closterium sp. NIES-54]
MGQWAGRVAEGWGENEPLSSAVDDLWQKLRHVASIRTCQLIMLQGVVSQAPWSALLFLSMWLELIGFDPSRAAELVSLLSLGFLLGSLTAGWVGDRASQHIPHLGLGRILCANISTGVVVLLSVLLLNVFPPSPAEAAASAVVSSGAAALPASSGYSASSSSPSWGFLVLWESAPHALLFCLIGLGFSQALKLALYHSKPHETTSCLPLHSSTRLIRGGPAVGLTALEVPPKAAPFFPFFLPPPLQVVPSRLRTTAYAADIGTRASINRFWRASTDMALGRLSAAFGGPAVGLAAIHLYGFSTTAASAAMAGRSVVALAAATSALEATGSASSAAAAGAAAATAGGVEAGVVGDVLGAGGAGFTGLAASAAAAAAANAEALAKGLFLAIAVPYAVNVMLIAACFWAYPEDRKHASVANWVDASSGAGASSAGGGGGGGVPAGAESGDADVTRTEGRKAGKAGKGEMADKGEHCEVYVRDGVGGGATRQGRPEHYQQLEMQLQQQRLRRKMALEPGSNEMETESRPLLRPPNV